MAQNVMRPVAALAIGCHQQPFIAERKPVDGIHIQRVDVGQAMLFGHHRIVVASAAGARNVQGIDRRPGIALGKDGMGISMATGAGIGRRLGVHASGQPLRFVSVTGLAFDRRHLVGMRIFFDGGVAIAARKAAVQARGKRLPVHADAVSGGIIEGHVPVAGEAIGLRVGDARRGDSQERTECQR